MRSAQIYFEDADWVQLMEKKGDLSWRAFVLKLAGIKRAKA